ncbi:MAG TPA: hypothetical protein VKN73_11825 [Desulfosalsimonadaceae bacterium]|nr:hypothetical protein [Desulfosalsimonadaceae bacterium]
MSKEKKTNSELIIDTLRSGKALRSPDITEMVGENSGKDIKIQDVASILAKLSNSNKCDLGYLIKKQKTDRGYVYSLVKEAFNLTPEQTYDLTRKTGKNRFTMEEAIRKYPSLKKYVKSTRAKTPAKQPEARPAKRASTAASSHSREISGESLTDLLGELVKEITDQGGLNINVNLTVNFKGLGN